MFHPNDPIQVLIVDDDPSMVAALKRLLRGKGFKVLTAESGREALRILREAGPPMVITDWVMPGMDGLELCRRIRSSDDIGFTYIILLTGNTETEQLIAGFEAGADDYITKPFDSRAVLSRIKAAERIIRLEAFYRHHAVLLHKVNAEVTVMNIQLNRLAAELKQARDDAEEAQSAAEAADRTKSEFLANMSHEIRTPLTAIIGYSELLRESAERSGWPEEDREALAVICRNGEHVLEIVNDLLDLAKITAGRLTVERVVCSPRELVSTVASFMKARAEAKGLQLRVESAADVPETIVTDPTRLRQILLNLVGNAVKFTRTGGVRLRTGVVEDAHAPPMIQFDIEDTGIGIQQKDVPKLFNPFVQVDTSFTRESGGTGLGLAISQRLANMLGGDISVESRHGTGSTFRVTLSMGNADDTPGAADSLEAGLANPAPDQSAVDE